MYMVPKQQNCLKALQRAQSLTLKTQHIMPTQDRREGSGGKGRGGEERIGGEGRGEEMRGGREDRRGEGRRGGREERRGGRQRGNDGETERKEQKERQK